MRFHQTKMDAIQQRALMHGFHLPISPSSSILQLLNESLMLENLLANVTHDSMRERLRGKIEKIDGALMDLEEVRSALREYGPAEVPNVQDLKLRVTQKLQKNTEQTEQTEQKIPSEGEDKT